LATCATSHGEREEAPDFPEPLNGGVRGELAGFGVLACRRGLGSLVLGEGRFRSRRDVRSLWTPRKLVVGGHWGVPDGAGAITGNLTVVGQTAAGFVSVTLTNQPNPTTSNLNFPLGDTRANGITVPLASGSDAWLVYKASTSGKRTHLILDVSGYFE
jgi:hypothetical protein